MIKDNPLVTDLVGEKTTKLDPRVIFFGACDELQCHIMEVRCLIDDKALKDDLEHIVMTLSNIMGEIAKGKYVLQVDELESLVKLVKKYEINNGILTKFILPGSNLVSARIHITRCVARRCELCYAKVYEKYQTSKIVFEYLNKLSTLFYNIGLKYENK